MHKRSGLIAVTWLAVAASLVALAFSSPDVAWAKKAPKQEEPAEYGDAALGRMYHKQIVATYGIYDNGGLGAYVQTIGEELVAHAGGEDNFAWHFTVVDMDDINAFAMPGGFVYITRGLLLLLNSEAQLAAVLGHEIGHIVHGHHTRQQAAANAIATVSDKLETFNNEDSFNLGRLFGAGLIRGYGREMELEADEAGTNMISAMGHDPNAALEVMEIFKALAEFNEAESGLEFEEQDADPYHAMLSTHPDQERRRRELVDAAIERTGAPRDAGRTEFLKHLDGMAWTGSRKQGVIRDNRFLHHDLNFAVTFPEGWTIINLPDRIVGVAPQEAASMQVSMVPRTARKHRKVPVDRFFQKVFGMTKWQSAKTTEVNGLEAFLATVPHISGVYGERTGRLGVVYRGTDSFVFMGTTQDSDRQRRYDRKFDSIIQSTRQLAGEERAQAEPVSLHVVELAPGQSLSDFTPIDGLDLNDPAGLLRVINGMYPNGEPEPGDLIKTIR